MKLSRNLCDYIEGDNRWGCCDFYFPDDVTTPEQQTEYIKDRVEQHKKIIKMFEAKYPEVHWWNKGFVDKHMAGALLLQSVNDTYIIPSPEYVDYLEQNVEGVIGVWAKRFDGPREVRMARIALSAIQLRTPDDLQLVHSIMTVGDRVELAHLLAGDGRVRMLPAD